MMLQRTRTLWTAALVSAGFVVMAVAPTGCDGGETIPEGQLCGAGENIFCRCPGGAPGTKQCSEAGDGFGECGPCEDRPSNGPAGQGGFGNTNSVGGFGGDGSGGSAPGEKPLLAPCELDSDCATGICRFNYCTVTCEKVSECPYPKSECVSFESMTICMPTCATAIDCVLFTAPPSRCGYSKAIDNWDVTVCAEFGENHQLMPPGTDCLPYDHNACNLGYQQQQTVCAEQGVCAKGCFVNADCPDGGTCSSGGTSIGNCQ